MSYDVLPTVRRVLAVVAAVMAAVVLYFVITAPHGGPVLLLIDGSWSGRADPSAVTTCAEETTLHALETGGQLQVAPVSDPAHSSRWRPVKTRLGLWDRMRTDIVPKFKAHQLERVMSDVRAVMTSPEPLPSSSDVLSATWTASQHISTLRPELADRDDVTLVVCSDASTVSRDLNSYTDDLSPQALQDIFERRRTNGDLADLRHVTVIFGAAGRDPKLDPDRAGPIRRMWTVDWKAATEAAEVIYDSVPQFERH
jgi:hypothetical protein